MRIDYDNVVRVGDMNTIHLNNPILKRRQRRKEDDTLTALRATVKVSPERQTNKFHVLKMTDPTPSPVYIQATIEREAPNTDTTTEVWEDWTGPTTEPHSGVSGFSDQQETETVEPPSSPPPPMRRLSSVSESLASLTEKMKRSPSTPVECLHLMSALTVIGQGLDDMQDELALIRRTSRRVRGRVEGIERQVSAIESELGTVHGKIDNLVNSGSSGGTSESSDTYYEEERSMM
eukprot:sb/3469306/